MQSNFAVTWAFAIQSAIDKTVKARFPQLHRTWPSLQTFDFAAYILPDGYMVVILRDKLSGIPSEQEVSATFPHSDYPALPPRVGDTELWQFYLRAKFSLREEDAPFLVPTKDSGANDASKHYELFTAEEQFFWNHQLNYVISRYNAYLQTMSKPPPVLPAHVTYNVSGNNSRINVNSQDLSVNVIDSRVTEVFEQVREAGEKVTDPIAKAKIDMAIEELEKAYGAGNFLSKYQAFISVAADHMTLFAPILPALTALLT